MPASTPRVLLRWQRALLTQLHDLELFYDSSLLAYIEHAAGKQYDKSTLSKWRSGERQAPPLAAARHAPPRRRGSRRAGCGA